MNLKQLGSIAIVSGTAIGAGMLALPLATAALGIIPASILMLLVWGLSAYTSLLMLELNLRSGVGENFHAICGKLLGRKGQLIQSAAFLSLLFALTAAYLTGGASLLMLRAESLFNLTMSNEVAVLLFALGLGVFAALGVAWVDKLSRLLFSVMIVLLVMVVLFLLPEASPSQMLEVVRDSSATHPWMVAIPVVFTSFGFHVCIATLVRYLDGDTASLRKVLLIGSAIPLVCYILWLVVTLGTVGANEISLFGGSLSKLIDALQQISANPFISNAISIFADLALVTSFLGVTLSLFDYIAELVGSNNKLNGRIGTWLLTFVPPLALALFMPEGFVAILGYAAISLVVFIVFLPIAMAYKQRQQIQTGYQVMGGHLALMLAAIFGVVIIAAQLVSAWG